MKEKTSLIDGYGFWLIAFLFIFLIIIFIIIYVKKIRTNDLVIENNIYLCNEIKEFQNTILNQDIQLKEIHHRTKNNLQLISSLLNIQSHNNLNFKDFIQKGQSRIHSISLLHQNLYESEYTDKVNFNEYAQSLVNSIFDVYVNKNNIKTEVNSNYNLLDVDTAIPLGLIITELVCNSFKHAFVNRDEGIIKIDLLSSDAINFEVIIKDNGIGFPENLSHDKSLGLVIVEQLVLQLKGELLRTNQNGTSYTIRFKK